MLRTPITRVAAVAAIALVATAALAQPTGVNLVVNGDAATGDVTGWIDGGVEAFGTDGPGVLGVPVGMELGEFCFTGSLGAESETLIQTIDLSARAADIDAGELTATFSVLTQSRLVPGAHDRGIVTLEYRNSAGVALAAATFEDQALVDIHDWTFFEDQRTLPAGARSVWIRLLATRDVGASTDAYFDNVSLVLAAACLADLDGDGALTIFDFLLFQNLFDAGDPLADFDGDGSLTIFDFLAFQNAFDAGC
jgi:hypothetical protein